MVVSSFSVLLVRWLDGGRDRPCWVSFRFPGSGLFGLRFGSQFQIRGILGATRLAGAFGCEDRAEASLSTDAYVRAWLAVTEGCTEGGLDAPFGVLLRLSFDAHADIDGVFRTAGNAGAVRCGADICVSKIDTVIPDEFVAIFNFG